MTNSRNKTIIQLLFLVAIICLISGYCYYDCQRYQALEKEFKEKIAAIEAQLANLGRKTVGLETGEQSAEESESVQLGGIIKKIENGIITLEGKVFQPGEKRVILLNHPENKEYRIAVGSETLIQRNDQEIDLGNLGEGDIINIIGKVNSFNEQEIIAENIFLFE